MKTESWETDRIQPYENNPRVNEPAVDAVARSIDKFGFRQPIVVDASGVIVVGHTRWKAAKKLGLEEVPVHVAADLSPERARAYRIADNKTAELSSWDNEALSSELRSIRDIGLDLESLGFSDDLLRDLIMDEPGLIDRDEVPAPPSEAITRHGDLWLLGKHRLLCGSSIEPSDVARLAESPVALAITDPPFDMDALEQVRALRLAGVKTAVVFGAGREIFRLANTKEYALRFDFVIVYDRSVALSGKKSLIYRHNRILLMDCALGVPGPDDGCTSGCVIGRGIDFSRDKYASVTGTHCSVLQAPVQRHIYGYGKCCDLFRAFVRAMDSPVIYDPFAGSGTSLIACEIEGKQWLGMELDPAVVDIAVKRWEEFTGRKAERVTAEATS
ncbi:MAG: ParB N-terminal domain-containing protein [Planctomycetota bacterium]|jgi:site-specific DNA-methyltransferase (adenine-specific)